MPVEQFIGRPTQCFKCLRYGHVARQCKSTNALCIKCSKVRDENHICEFESFCLYCKTTDHNSISKNCPINEKQSKIRTIMNNRNMSFLEAKQFDENSFSSVSTNNNRFSVLPTDDPGYNLHFPKIGNNNKNNNHQPIQSLSNLAFTRKPVQVRTQATTSESIDSVTQISKKRKASTSPTHSPPTDLLFPFRFGSPTSLPHNTPNYHLQLVKEQESTKYELIESFSNYIFKILNRIQSMDDLKCLNDEIVRKDIKKFIDTSLKI